MTRVLMISIALTAFTLSGVFTHFYNRTDDLSLRYVLWKNNFHPYPSDIIETSLQADKKRHNLICGQSKAEVKQIFPSAHKETVNDYQKMYESLDLKNIDYLWIDDGIIVVFFENGIGTEILLMKG